MKAYSEVTQWQGKEMRNLGRCLLGVLAVAVRQPDSRQVIPFKHALDCVRALVDFKLMAQYRSEAPETIAYMEEYLDWFHRMKDICLEFRVSKQTRAKVDKQRKDLRHQRAQSNMGVAPSKRRRRLEEDRDEENELRIDKIHTESHFNFVKLHLLSHFSDHIRQFGNIPMYSTEFGELTHKEQIKDRWRGSNKNHVERQILHSYGRQHAIRMRLLNLNSLRRRGANLGDNVLGSLDKTTSAVSTPAPRARIVKGRRDDVSDVLDFCKVLGMSLDQICVEWIRYSRHNLPTERRLPEEPAILQLLPVELLTQLEITVLAFQESDVYDIHRARCTGTHRFLNQESRNDWVCVQAGSEEMYGALRVHLPATLVALFEIRECSHDTVRRVAGVQMLSPVDSGRPPDIHSLVTVQLREDARELTLVDIGTILGLAHLIPERDRRWLVNSRIHLRTFNVLC